MIKKFCRDNDNKMLLISEFLANCQLKGIIYNNACTCVMVNLYFKDKSISLKVNTSDINDPHIVKNNLIDALFRSFRLSSQWYTCKFNSHLPWHSIQEEFKTRGGEPGFIKVVELLNNLHMGGVPQKKLRDRRLQGDLNRVLVALRKAKKSGATFQQLNEQFQTFIITEVHDV